MLLNVPCIWCLGRISTAIARAESSLSRDGCAVSSQRSVVLTESVIRGHMIGHPYALYVNSACDSRALIVTAAVNTTKLQAGRLTAASSNIGSPVSKTAATSSMTEQRLGQQCDARRTWWGQPTDRAVCHAEANRSAHGLPHRVPKTILVRRQRQRGAGKAAGAQRRVAERATGGRGEATRRWHCVRAAPRVPGWTRRWRSGRAGTPGRPSCAARQFLHFTLRFRGSSPYTLEGIFKDLVTDIIWGWRR